MSISIQVTKLIIINGNIYNRLEVKAIGLLRPNNLIQLVQQIGVSVMNANSLLVKLLICNLSNLSISECLNTLSLNSKLRKYSKHFLCLSSFSCFSILSLIFYNIASFCVSSFFLSRNTLRINESITFSYFSSIFLLSE